MEEKFEMLWKLLDEVVREKLVTKDNAISIGINLAEAQSRCQWQAQQVLHSKATMVG